MPVNPLPDSVEEFDGLNWNAIQPYIDDLLARELTPDNTVQWLRDWSKLNALLADTYTTLHIAYDLDTTDDAKKAAAEKYIAEIYPRSLMADHQLKQKLVASGYDAPEHAVMLRSIRSEIEIFRDENVPLLSEVRQLSLEYQKIMGGMTVEFDGKERTIQQLYPYQLKTDRAIRQAAWRAARARQMQARQELHDLFDKMLALRHQIALNAGFENFRDYTFHSMGRFDYTPDDCKAFHAAIEQAVVPVVEKRLSRRRMQMGLDSLRPWDTAVDPLGRDPIYPFEKVETLVKKSQAIFEQLDPTLAGYFATMADENLLELESRKGKAPGGYSTTFNMRQRAFIFMNVVGTASDVRTLLHEAGHSFHTFEMASLPLIWDRDIPMEIAEVASMAMELLAGPYLGEFFSDDELVRARVDHLEGTVSFLPYMAVVDAFQHWLYENPEHSHEERDAQWMALMERFMPGVEWDGLEDERASYWQRQLHIFEVPFYYVEYGIAQVGAWQVWRNSLQDAQAALEDYRAALALGYTRPLPELYETAGAQFALGNGRLLNELMTLIETQLADWEGES